MNTRGVIPRLEISDGVESGCTFACCNSTAACSSEPVVDLSCAHCNMYAAASILSSTQLAHAPLFESLGTAGTCLPPLPSRLPPNPCCVMLCGAVLCCVQALRPLLTQLLSLAPTQSSALWTDWAAASEYTVGSGEGPMDSGRRGGAVCNILHCSMVLARRCQAEFKRTALLCDMCGVCVLTLLQDC